MRLVVPHFRLLDSGIFSLSFKNVYGSYTISYATTCTE